MCWENIYSFFLPKERSLKMSLKYFEVSQEYKQYKNELYTTTASGIKEFGIRDDIGHIFPFPLCVEVLRLFYFFSTIAAPSPGSDRKGPCLC